ncbi:MAG: UDP-N-acetylmuramoyl-tripeptide--D-alanyl-D-alanine ligase [Armatimonadetes bacterium]|nr:UDP-N-acetylmuramoyl-tripeptide--D-alanyl-D-alanine ligase [Armatimonadota bacterium]
MIGTTAQLAEQIGAELIGAGDIGIERAITDSRLAGPGALFVALAGERFDGHDFVEQAWAAGASAVLASRPVACRTGGAVLVVEDTLLAFGRLGAAWREHFADLLMVAITGSLGKTSSKELTWQVLSQRGATLRSASSFNNEIGVPTTLLNLTSAHWAAVQEMGMRGLGQIAYLAAMVRPSIGVITNIGHSHLGVLGSRQAIAQAKGELLDALGPDGIAVLNADDDHLPGVSKRHDGRIVWYGQSRGAEVRAEAVQVLGLAGTRFDLCLPDERVAIEAPIVGAHMVSNALAAAAVGHAAGLSAAEIAAGLSLVPDLKLRGELVRLANGARVINDAYNAAPESVRAALAVLAAEPTTGRRIAVLGGIAELGDTTTVEHMRLGRDAAGLVDIMVGVGPEGAEIVSGAERGAARTVVVEDVEAAGAWLAATLRAGDLALLKASRAYGLERALDGLEVAR